MQRIHIFTPKSFSHRLRVEAIYGGSSFYSQEKAIRSGVHILVATPGRALDHISRRTVDLSNVEHVVLDEGNYKFFSKYSFSCLQSNHIFQFFILRRHYVRFVLSPSKYTNTL